MGEATTAGVTSTIRLAAALTLCAIAVRPLAVSLGPIIPDIQSDLGAGEFLAGLVGMVPIVCLGLFAPIGVRLTDRLRPESALAVALCLTIGFGAARAFAPDVTWLILLTVGLGSGMGMAGALPSMIIKTRAPDRPASMTSAHGLGIVAGSVLGAMLIVPLSMLGGGWRGATLLVSGLILVASVVGLVLLGRGRDHPRRPGPRSPGIPWRDPVAWLVAAIFGLQSFVYWGLVIWLAAVLIQDGWTVASAGVAVTVFQLGSLAGVLSVGFVADRWGTRRQQLLLAASAVAIALLGLLITPGVALLWVALAGCALGAALPLVLALPVDVSRDEQDAGAKAGLMLLVGYLVAAAGPAVVGLVREQTTASAPVFITLVLASLAFIAAASRLGPGARPATAGHTEVGALDGLT